MNSAHRRARLKHYGAPVPENLKHGRDSYARRIYGCDCKVCLPSGRRRAANGEGMSPLERQKRLRASKKGQPVPPRVKHGVYAYKTYGCRCDICEQTIRRNRRMHKTWAWLKRATGHYDFGEESVVIHWPPVGHGTWTCPRCGQQFPHRRQTESAASTPKEARLAA